MKCRFPVIAFTGPLQVGKSSAARAFFPEGEVSQNSVLFSFAESGKRMLELIGVPPRNLRTPEGKKEPIPEFGGKTGRELMQTLMTDWGRKMVAPDIWLTVAARTMVFMVQNNVLVVIDDLRFDNEAEVVHELGGMVIEITRPGVNYSTGHASERGIMRDFIDRTLANDSTTEALHAKVLAACCGE